MDISISTSTIIGFILYSATLSLFLLPSKLKRESSFWMLLTLFSAYNIASGLVSLSTIFFILFVFILTRSIEFSYRSIASKCVYSLIALTSLLLALHIVPGFNNERVFGPQILNGSAIPFKLYANIDKGYGALLLLYLHSFRLSSLEIYTPNKQELLLGCIGIVAIFSIATMMGTSWSPKYGQLTWAFLFFNLFVTCVAEEAFFRLVIQDKLYKRLPRKWNNYTAPLMTSFIFMLAHFHMGEGAAERLLLIFLAGLVYALVYQIRRSLLSAITVHFLLNFLHFSFFSYPASF